MQDAASLTLRSFLKTLTLTGLVILCGLCASARLTGAQTFAREVQAKLAAARVLTEPEGEPAVVAELALLLPDKSRRISSRIIFHRLTLNAANATAGWFRIYNQRDDVIFEGRWMATTFRQGETLISLEGRGDEEFAARRLKLKLKAVTTADTTLSGEGTGEIR